MAASGVDVNSDVTELFTSMKMKHTHKFALFYIKDKKSIECLASSDHAPTKSREEDKACFDEMVTHLTNEEPRFVLYDFGFCSKEGRQLEKLAFIFWSPDVGKISLKMLYASSKDALKKQFTGLAYEFQANDKSDVVYEDLADEIEKRA